MPKRKIVDKSIVNDNNNDKAKVRRTKRTNDDFVATGDESSSSNNNNKNRRMGSTTTKTKTNRRWRIVMILSPAKTLDLNPMDRDTPIPWSEVSCDRTKYQQVIDAMKSHTGAGGDGGITKLRTILNVSTNLAVTAKEYWQSIQSSTTIYPTKPCIYAFSGAAYQGLDISTLTSSSTSSLEYLQNNLRIIDPLYGWLRPMDVIEPYRLEMANKGVLPSSDDVVVTNKDELMQSKSTRTNGSMMSLSEFWKPSIRSSIEKEEVSASEAGSSSSSSIVILNLASDEYSAAVEWPNMVKVIFRHGGRVLSVHAKRARGLMVRYMAQHRIVDNFDAVKGFNLEGYTYRPTESKCGDDPDDIPTALVFDRPVDWNKPSNKSIGTKKTKH